VFGGGGREGVEGMPGRKGMDRTPEKGHLAAMHAACMVGVGAQA